MRDAGIIYSAFQGEVRIDDQQVLTTGEFGGKPRFDLDRGSFFSLAARRSFADCERTCRGQSDPLPLPLPRHRPPRSSPFPRRRREEHHPASPYLDRARQVQRLHDARVQGRSSAVQDHAPTPVPHPPHQAVHEEQLCRGEEPDYRQLPSSWRRHERMCVPSSHFRWRASLILASTDVQDGGAVAQYYDLVSNITHSSAAGTAREETTWKAQVHLRPPRDEIGVLRNGLSEDDEKWFQIQDLIVDEINRGMIALGESYIQVRIRCCRLRVALMRWRQIWERRTPTGTHDLKVDPPKKKKTGL